MPSKRSSNAQQKRRAKRSPSKAARERGARQSLMPERGTAANDIIGVIVIVVAIAMLVAIATPSSAPVTHALGAGLELLFGVGAFLCPVALIVFSAHLFVGGGSTGNGRIGIGLLLVVTAILGLLSINVPMAETNPQMVLQPAIAVGRGGYWGGVVAWLLLESVGTAVGNVILVGLMVTGVIVCGFSLSGAIDKAKGRVSSAKASREAGRSADLPAYDANYGQPPVAAGTDDSDGMIPIGRRQTTVFRRPQGEEPSDEADSSSMATTVLDDEAGRKTTLLSRRRKRHPPLDEEDAVPAGTASEAEGSTERGPSEDVNQRLSTSESSDTEGAVPDFLRNARGSGMGAGCSAESGDGRVEEGAARPQRRHGGARTGAGAVGVGASAAPASGVSASASSRKPSRGSASKATTAGVKRPGDGFEDYKLPPFSMLSSNPNSANANASRAELDETKDRLQGTLREFGLSSRVVDYVSGPIVTTFRIEMGEGERVSRIKNLEDDIALTLAAEKVRIFAPIRGTSYVGIEIPNRKRTNVHLGDVLPYATGGPLEVAIGRDSAGKPVVADIAKMPHMLVAGTTGSGKSVMINSMVMSLLMRTTPKQVRLIMIDPKRVEFSCYNGLPHLYVPVVTDPRQAASALQWAVSEMERRLKVFERAGARNISVYNQMCTTGKLSEMDNPPEPMPYIVVVIDELSDLMMTAGKDVEASIVRIAQLARAAGIHLVIATQRPSANVVTGLIKSNIDSRVALKVSSGIDSRVILDDTGAERLLGNGDMLFKDRGLAPKRVLGCYTSDDEIESVVQFIRDQAEPDYHNEILSQVVPGQTSSGADAGGDDDPLVWEAAQIVVDSQLGSTSGLQRRLKVGYARAGRIMDMLEAKGVVGPPEGSKPREVLLDKEGLEELKQAEEKYGEV